MSNDEVTERAVEMLRQAMASGAAAFVEKVRAGEVDPSAPMTEAFGDFPREFLSIRASLFDGLLASPERDAAVSAKALRRVTEAESMDLWWLASCDGWGVPEGLPKAFLTTVADWIEREAGESDADA